MSINYTAISAWMAVIAALTVIFVVWIEGTRARFSQGLDLLFKLEDLFNSEKFVNRRRNVTRVLNNKIGKRDNKWEVDVGEILDHFQLVGILLHRGALDGELVHSEYYYWVSYYYHYLHSVISDWREGMHDPTAWEDVDYLYKELSKIENRYRRMKSSFAPTESNLKEFLLSEINL
jgi:hypothetical protein